MGEEEEQESMLCSGMKEKREQEEVGVGREEWEGGREPEGGWGRERSKAGRKGGREQRHRGVGGIEHSGKRRERGR